MIRFKLLTGAFNKSFIPEDHYIIHVTGEMYSPLVKYKAVYHKHRDPYIERVHKMYIGEDHYLWNWEIGQ